jgi:ankyrin repeat protein
VSPQENVAVLPDTLEAEKKREQEEWQEQQEVPNVATAALDPKFPQSLIDAEAEPTPQPIRPKKTLIKAAKENNLQALEELLKSGANLEDLGMWDNTPLLVACTYGHAEAALRLIHHKANVMASNEHGATPLHYAAVEGMLDVVEALLANVRGEGGEADAVKLLNCKLAKVYNRHLDAYATRSPLGSAAESGFADVVGVLLAAGAQIEEADEDGRTPLWLASRHARLGVVRLLLQHGADTGVKDSKGASVLEAGTLASNEELVLALLGAGVADVNDTIGSPLRDAVRSGKRGMVEALLTHGASVEMKPGVVGNPPLHAACEKGDEYLVSLLVRARADPSLSNAAGQTAFDLLRRRGLPDGQIVNLLRPPIGVGGADGSTGATGETSEVL